MWHFRELLFCTHFRLGFFCHSFKTVAQSKNANLFTNICCLMWWVREKEHMNLTSVCRGIHCLCCCGLTLHLAEQITWQGGPWTRVHTLLKKKKTSHMWPRPPSKEIRVDLQSSLRSNQHCQVHKQDRAKQRHQVQYLHVWLSQRRNL